MGTPIDFLDFAEILGVTLCRNVKYRNINGCVEKLYYQMNSVLYHFKDIPDVKSKLLDTYC